MTHTCVVFRYRLRILYCKDIWASQVLCCVPDLIGPCCFSHLVAKGLLYFLSKGSRIARHSQLPKRGPYLLWIAPSSLVRVHLDFHLAAKLRSVMNMALANFGP